MKTIGMVLMFAFIVISFTTLAQDASVNKMTLIDQEINSKNYSFQAQYAMPLNGR